MNQNTPGALSRPVSVARACQIISTETELPVSAKTIYRWLSIEAGQRPESLRRVGGRLMVKPADLQAWVESKIQAPYAT